MLLVPPPPALSSQLVINSMVMSRFFASELLRGVGRRREGVGWGVFGEKEAGAETQETRGGLERGSGG